MNILNRQWLYTGFRKELRVSLDRDTAEMIWEEAGREYDRILSEQPQLKKHRGSMVLPAVALYRVPNRHGKDAEILLNRYGEMMGRRFAKIIHVLTSIPGADRFVWHHAESVMDRMSSARLGYRRELVSRPPEMYGVDILSCPYHELAKELGEEKAVLCICHMDKEYSQGFRHIRYDRNSAVSEGARACEYRLRFDPEKE